MPTIVDIDVIRSLLEDDWAELDALCEGLDAEQWSTPTCLPRWTVADVLAHVVGTERMLEGEPMPDVDVSRHDHLRNDMAKMVEAWVEDLRGSSGQEVLERFRAIRKRRSEALAAMDQGDFDAPSWTPVGKDETYGRFMRLRHFDTYLHEHDIRDALGVEDRPDVAAIEASLEEVVPSLGYIVGRKAGLADGTVVRLELTGPVLREYVVAVEDGRANVVDPAGTSPGVSLAMTNLVFLRLTGGRCGPERFLGDSLEISGDQGTGLHLASNMAMTI